LGDQVTHREGSSRVLRTLSLIVAVAGAIVAGYLTYVYLTDAETLCTGVGGCDAVKHSRFAHIGGIPIAALGLAGYLAIVGSLVLESSGSLGAEYGPILVFGLSLLGTLYSAYLTYLELFVIRAICPYCVASAVLMTIEFGLSIARLLTTDVSTAGT
jgi:uncharacterized membrane protein